MIRFIQRKQIDTERWNEVISSSRFESVYPYTWYLDAAADQWGAFVMADYDFIMPVPFRKKVGFQYVYMPRFCQQLGVFSIKEVSPEIVKLFMIELGRKFKLGEYAFNEGNVLGEEKGFEVSDNSNYTLPLSEQYEEILKSFGGNCKRNVKKAYLSGLVFTEDIDVEEVVLLKRSMDMKAFSDEHYQFLTKMFNAYRDAGQLKIYGVRLDGHLSAAATFVFSKKRIHYLLSFSTEAGKERSAMFMVIDSVLQQYAESDMLLDFEGSNMPSIARFFGGFGAKPHIYQRISIQNSRGKLVRKIRNVKRN